MTLNSLIQSGLTDHPTTQLVWSDGEWFSSAEIHSRSNQVASLLRSRGVGTGSLVGICAERSADLIVGLVGMLKPSGAYVPLQPSAVREETGDHHT